MKKKLTNLIILFLFTCSINANAHAKFLPDASNKHLNQTAVTTVIRFMKWYKAHRQEMLRMNLIQGDVGDTTKEYKINHSATKRYLAKLKESKYVSDILLANVNERINNLGLRLKGNPVFGGPIEEMETDLIYHTQEYSLIDDYIDQIKLKSKSIVNGKCLLLMKINKQLMLNAYLTKYGKHWLIDHIVLKY